MLTLLERIILDNINAGVDVCEMRGNICDCEMYDGIIEDLRGMGFL